MALAMMGLTVFTHADAAEPLPPVTEADGRLGTCFSALSEEDPRAAYEAGSRWDRFPFRWADIEPQPGDFDVQYQELQVTRALSHDLNIVGILGATPAWAADCPTTRTATLLPAGHIAPLWSEWWHACPPQGLALSWDHPNNDWAAHVQAVVNQFKDDVHVWEIWNEPDANWYWKGTPEQYAHLLKVGYHAVKFADPDATVLFGGLAYWENPAFYMDVLDALAANPEDAAHNFFFDVMSLHLYANVYQSHNIAAQVSAEVAARVGPHPLWLTEAGIKVWPEGLECPGEGECPPYYSAEEDEVAAYMIEAFANARAAGVERMLIFRLRDDEIGMPYEDYGLLRADGTPRPSYVAAQVAARYLRDENQVTGPFGETIHRVTFWGTPHGRVDVLWNRTATTTTYRHPALLPTATLVDRLGVTRTVTATDGGFPLTLGLATANRHPNGELIIGGPPLLLLQTDTVSPTSALDPLPPTAPHNPLTVTWTVSDTGTGYWYAEIAYGSTPTGPWTLADSWNETQYVTQTQITLPDEGIWYLRGRVRDRAGNWEPWPRTAEVSTTLELTTLALSVTTFSDLNRNHVQEAPEPLLDDVAFSLEPPTGQPITQTVGSRWQFTQTLLSGPYILRVEHPDHIPVDLPIDAGAEFETVTVSRSLGLALLHRMYLPLTLRE
jgi:hypothetical protein